MHAIPGSACAPSHKRLEHLWLTLTIWLFPCQLCWHYLQCLSNVICTLATFLTSQLRHVEKTPVLPPPSSPGRLTIVLDLDETLIASWAPAEAPACISDLACHRMHLPFGAGVTDCTHSTRHGRNPSAQSPASLRLQPQFLSYSQVLVVQRPGLHQFLRSLSAFAELVLFTAAVPEYAQPVIQEVLDPDNTIFEGRVLYRQYTTLFRPPPSSTNQSAQCIKDLSTLGRDLARVVMVDNNPYSFLHQPANGVPCLPFRSDPCDRHLSAVLLPLLQSLALFQDVRPILDARFKLGDWFTQRGLPTPPPPPAGTGALWSTLSAPVPGAAAGAHRRYTAPAAAPGGVAAEDAESQESGCEGGGRAHCLPTLTQRVVSHRRVTHL